MRRTLGTPFGGTTWAGQYGLESLESRLIVPPNGAGGGGRYLPSIVVVAPGEPGVPVVWAKVEPAVRARTAAVIISARMVGVVEFMVRLLEMIISQLGLPTAAPRSFRMLALSSTTITTVSCAIISVSSAGRAPRVFATLDLDQWNLSAVNTRRRVVVIKAPGAAANIWRFIVDGLRKGGVREQYGEGYSFADEATTSSSESGHLGLMMGRAGRTDLPVYESGIFFAKGLDDPNQPGIVTIIRRSRNR